MTPRAPQQWFDPRGRRGLGWWAYLAMRVSGLGLVVYLYLHLAILRQLADGPQGWDAFITLARQPLFLALDLLLIAGLLIHGLNGVRVILLGLGLGVQRQQALTLIVAALALVLTALSAVALFSKGG